MNRLLLSFLLTLSIVSSKGPTASWPSSRKVLNTNVCISWRRKPKKTVVNQGQGQCALGLCTTPYWSIIIITITSTSKPKIYLLIFYTLLKLWWRISGATRWHCSTDPWARWMPMSYAWISLQYDSSFRLLSPIALQLHVSFAILEQIHSQMQLQHVDKTPLD